MSHNAFEELQWRGLIFDYMEGVPELLVKEKVTVYNGFDPTADSLHVGHTLPLIALARLQRFGHTPIAVAGGGTGMIGDPSGKSSERQLLSREQIEYNVSCIQKQLAHLLDFEVKSNPARLVNNADWLLQLNLVDFLRDIGKHFTVNYMLAKDSVKSRIDREEGISFTEFSYMLLQSYDFLHLYDTFGCKLQTGGSDQWGNITAGAELIRRVRGGQAYGMVYHLITKADGTKFGKTESGSVWLDPNKTSPYRFYQFWLNTDDRDVVKYLKYFTFFTREEIAELEASLAERPEQREPHRALARAMTQMIHGETALARAEQASQALFGGELETLTAAEIADIFSEVPSCEVPRHQLEGEGYPLVDLLVTAGVAKSKGEARRNIQEGGIYVNNRRVEDLNRAVHLQDALQGQFVVLRKGRKNYTLVRLLA
ncbi:tyrosine--tRNA ligase [Anaerolinea sp.]|uniref:tyrosine--tRNA ligase n=1 Tax=Anaerolinea sp. TaxID=1872519 RepID=UPI002ACE2E8B|nr:tyrosine--tRNA ligase [Anaerolinea sp.]